MNIVNVGFESLCRVEFSSKKPENTTKTDSESDTEVMITDINTHRNRCQGKRTFFPWKIQNYPPLLIVQLPVTDEGMTVKPVQELEVGDHVYKLAAVIYTNNSKNHFNCHIMINGRPLFYDGLKSPKLQWTNFFAYSKTQFPIAMVWYQRVCIPEIANKDGSTLEKIDNVQEKEYIIEENLEKTNDLKTHLNIKIKIEDDEEKKRKLKSSLIEEFFNKENKKKIKKNKFPLGLSIQPVAKKGPVPVCVGCNQKLQRNEKRLVINKIVSNQLKKVIAYDVTSCHLHENCLQQALTVDQKKEYCDLVKLDKLL